MRQATRLVLPLWMLAVTASVAPAQIANYSFNGLTGTTLSPPGVAGTAGASAMGSVTVGNVLRGPGLTAQSATDGFNSSSFTLTTALADAITANDYYTFTLTPTAAGTFNFTSEAILTFGSRVSFTGSSPTLSLLTSRAGFTAANVVASAAITSTTASDYALSLNGLGSFAVNANEAVEFRLYGYGVNATNTQLRLENGTVGGLTVNGAFTPVPEPATVLAVAAGGLGLLRLRRRR